jgi:hypothetical protein
MPMRRDSSTNSLSLSEFADSTVMFAAMKAIGWWAFRYAVWYVTRA